MAGQFDDLKPTAEDTWELGNTNEVLVDLVARALRAEAGVKYKQTGNQPTGYYAGRRAGFVVSAAVLATTLYRADYEEVKSFISKAVKLAGENREAPELSGPYGKEYAAEVVASVLKLPPVL